MKTEVKWFPGIGRDAKDGSKKRRYLAVPDGKTLILGEGISVNSSGWLLQGDEIIGEITNNGGRITNG